MKTKTIIISLSTILVCLAASAQTQPRAGGPEWGLDAKGPAIFYIKDNAQGTGQLWRAAPPWDKPQVTQLTHDTDIHNWICEPSVSAKLPATRVIIYRGGGPKGGNVSAWLDVETPAKPHAFTERAYLARFSIDTPFISWSPRQRAGDRSTTQVSLLDTDTGKARGITADDGAKYDPWLWHAPESDGELLLCVNLDERALAIHRDIQRDGNSPWTRIAEIRLPADAPHPQLKSCEPVNGVRGAFGRSWFTAQGGDDKDKDTSIWLLGFDQNGHHTVRRLDDGSATKTTARRLDPETLVGERELFVYYTRMVGKGSELRLCRTGVEAAHATPSAPGHSPKRPDASGMQSETGMAVTGSFVFWHADFEVVEAAGFTAAIDQADQRGRG